MFTGANLLNRLGGFLLLPLYWSALGPEDYGVLAVIAIIGAFQALFSSLSLDLAITRMYYEWSDEDRPHNLGAIWVWNGISTVAVGGVFVLLAVLLGPWIFPDVPADPYLVLGIVANTLANLYLIPIATIRIKRMPWLFAFYNLSGFLVASVLGLWLVLWRGDGVHGYIVSTLLGNAYMVIVGWIAMSRFARPSLSAPGLRHAFKLSLPAIPSDLIGNASAFLDRFLLSYFANLETLGVYAISLKFTELIGSVHSALKMSFGPFLMKQLTGTEDRARGRQTVASVTVWYLIPYFVGALGLMLFIGPLVRIIDQPRYFPVVDWVPWLTGVAVMSYLYVYYANGIVLSQRTDLLWIPATVQLAVMAIAGLALIGPWQMSGLVVSRYASAIVFFAVSVYLSQRLFPQPQRWPKLAAMAAGLAAVGAASPLLVLDDVRVEIAIKVPIWLGYVGFTVWLARGEATRSASA